MTGDGFDQENLHKRMGVTEEYQLQGGSNTVGGRNFKSIHDKLTVKERMKIGSEVVIMSGTHEKMEGKVLAVVDPKAMQR